MEEYRLDTFERVVAALAGITEPSERTEVRRKLKSGSATTPTTFVLDGTFTHLICEDTKNSQTMQAVSRFRQKAGRFLRRGESLPEEGQWAKEMKGAVKIQTVWKEWVDDSLEVEGCMEEKYYSVDEPRMTLEQRRKLIEEIKKERINQKEKSKARADLAQVAVDDTEGARKAMTQVKETPSEGNDVQRVTKKPKIDLGQYVQQISKVESDETEQKINAPPERNERSLMGLTKAKSFTEQLAAPRSGKKDTSDQPISPFSNTIPLPEDLLMEEQEDEDEVKLEEDPAAGLQSEIREKSLTSLSFRLDLRDDVGNNAIRRALQKQGVAEILGPQDDGKAHFHILPLGKVNLPTLSKDELGTAVTRFFIERCLHESRVISMSESFALQPAVVPFPIPGAEKVFVGITGLAEGVDRAQAELAMKAAGIEASSTLKRGHHTHLLIGKDAEGSKSSQVKIERAKEWGIHCVGLEFVENLFRRGVIEPAVKKVERAKSLLQRDRGVGRGGSMGAATLGETQRFESQSSLLEQNENRPIGVTGHTSGFIINNSRPWQRSASSSQALLDGEVSRGVPLSSYARLHNVDSLEAGSQAIKTSAEEVMALLSNRHTADTSFESTTSSSSVAKKRGRLPPSRLRERRAGSTASNRHERTPSEVPTAEELLAMRKEEEEHFLVNSSTQAASMSTQDDQSMRVTYDDPISRRERRKIGDLIATSVKDKAQQEDARSSSTEADDDQSIMTRTSSMSPSKRRSISMNKIPFSPSIKARRQPGTCLRD
jgi:hypothetical protein